MNRSWPCNRTCFSAMWPQIQLNPIFKPRQSKKDFIIARKELSHFATFVHFPLTFLDGFSWNELYVHWFIDWVKNKPLKDNCREIWTYFESCKHLSSQAHIVTFFYIVCSHIMVYTKWLMNLILSIFSGQFGMRVKRCFSFSDTNNTVQLVDDNGWVVLKM